MSNRFALFPAVAVAALLLLSACDDKNPAPIPAPPSAEPAASETPAASPLSNSSVSRVVALLDTPGTLKAVEERVRPALESQILALYRGADQAAVADAKRSELLKNFNDKRSAIDAQLGEALQRDFTAAELDDIAAFLNTPAGAKFTSKLPELKQNAENAAMQQASQLLSSLMQEQIRQQQEQLEETPANNDDELPVPAKTDVPRAP